MNEGGLKSKKMKYTQDHPAVDMEARAKRAPPAVDIDRRWKWTEDYTQDDYTEWLYRMIIQDELQPVKLVMSRDYIILFKY